jgi:thiol-disulfide isomerase/thioredoxin
MDPVFVMSLRVGLGAIFAIAFLAKMVDRDGLHRSVAAFGCPKTWVTQVSASLLICEAATAYLLTFPRWGYPGALAAFVLLGVFTAVSIVAIYRGDPPECRCFGNIIQTKINGGTIVRNIILMAIATAICWDANNVPDSSVFALFSELFLPLEGYSHAKVFTGLVVCQCLHVIYMFVWQRRLQAQIDRLSSAVLNPAYRREIFGLTIGSKAPGFALTGTNGVSVTSSELFQSGKAVALLFLAPSCGGCAALVPLIPGWNASLNSNVMVVVIGRNSPADNTKVSGLRSPDILLQKHDEVSRLYRVSAFPSAILVDDRGLIASDIAVGERAIKQFVGALLKP